VAQRIVVVEVLVPERQRIDALGHQILDRVLDQRRIAMVEKAARKLTDDARGPLTPAQQQRARIRTDRPAIKTGHDLSCAKGVELQRLCATVCPHEAASDLWCNYFVAKHLYHIERPCATLSVRNAG